MAVRFNAPPGWPAVPAGWSPPPGWQADRTWPAAPTGWHFWIPADSGADLVLAWPEAELGIMSARAAVGVVHRRELRAAEDVDALRDRLADEYFDEHLRAESAAAAGFVDELVEPCDTRERLAGALWTLAAHRVS